MNWSKVFRQAHRWLSMIFVLTMIAVFIAMVQEKPVEWVFYLPLLPLMLLLLSGLYLFVQPYFKKQRPEGSV